MAALRRRQVIAYGAASALGAPLHRTAPPSAAPSSVRAAGDLHLAFPGVGGVSEYERWLEPATAATGARISQRHPDGGTNQRFEPRRA
jgi:hypothetical protein